MRFLIGFLIAIFLLPLFAGAGLMGGCFVGLIMAESNPGSGNDAAVIACMAVPALLGAALAIFLSVLITRSLKVN